MAEAIGDPKIAAGLALASVVNFAFSITRYSTVLSAQEQIATYQAAQYVTEQLSSSSLDKEDTLVPAR